MTGRRASAVVAITRERPRELVAVLLLVASTALIAWMPSLGSPSVALFVGLASVAAAAFLALAWQAWRVERDGPSGATSRWILGVALLLRAPALVAPPWLSDDLWRYLWEGRVQRAGVSPYVHAPDDPSLASLREKKEADGVAVRDEVAPRVAHPEIPAVYPPAAQLLFRLAPESARGFKLVVAAADVGVVLLLLSRLRRRGLPAARAVLYAWHPLVALEFCGSGHVDAIALLFVSTALLAARRDGSQGLLVGLAGMVKPQGLAPLVGFVAQRRWRALVAAALTIVVVALPFARDGRHLFDGIARYAHDWEFNGLVYPPMVRVAAAVKRALEGLPGRFGLWWIREFGYPIVPNQLGRKLSTLLFLGATTLLARKLRDRPALLASCTIGAFLATAPAVHPWYVAWLVPFLPFVEPRVGRGVLLLTVTTLAANAVKVEQLASGVWEEPAWVGVVTWVPACTLFAFDLWRAPSSLESVSRL